MTFVMGMFCSFPACLIVDRPPFYDDPLTSLCKHTFIRRPRSAIALSADQTVTMAKAHLYPSLTLCLLLLVSAASCQEAPASVAFIGNSYTYYNDLPGLVRSLAEAAGHSLEVGEHTEGGWTWEDVSTMHQK